MPVRFKPGFEFVVKYIEFLPAVTNLIYKINLGLVPRIERYQQDLTFFMLTGMTLWVL